MIKTGNVLAHDTLSFRTEARPLVVSIDDTFWDHATDDLALPGDEDATKGEVVPVEQDGKYFLCRETDNSCECIPFPG